VNYRMAGQFSAEKTEDWTLHHCDLIGMLSDKEAQLYINGDDFKTAFKGYIANEIAKKLLETGAIQIETEYDVVRRETMYAARLKYLLEDK